MSICFECIERKLRRHFRTYNLQETIKSRSTQPDGDNTRTSADKNNAKCVAERTRQTRRVHNITNVAFITTVPSGVSTKEFWLVPAFYMLNSGNNMFFFHRAGSGTV